MWGMEQINMAMVEVLSIVWVVYTHKNSPIYGSIDTPSLSFERLRLHGGKQSGVNEDVIIVIAITQ